MTCHHIDWSGLQIVVRTVNGPTNPTYTCLLCQTVLDGDSYRELIDTIKEKKKNDTLKFWRTPKGEEHVREDCPDEERCDLHGDGL
jgi:hypothetical protein